MLGSFVGAHVVYLYSLLYQENDQWGEKLWPHNRQ